MSSKWRIGARLQQVLWVYYVRCTILCSPSIDGIAVQGFSCIRAVKFDPYGYMYIPLRPISGDGHGLLEQMFSEYQAAACATLISGSASVLAHLPSSSPCLV